MFWLFSYVFYFVLMPICLAIGIVNLIVYFPPKPEVLGYTKVKPFDLGRLPTISPNYTNFYGQDAAKFVGMQYYATGDDSILRYLLDNFIDREKLEFVRYGYENVIFSRDMLSGFLMAIVKGLKENKLTDDDKSILSEVLYKSVFRSIVPFSSKIETLDDVGRGFVMLPPIAVGFIYIQLNMLKLGAEVATGFRKFKFLLAYYLILIRSTPILLLSFPDRTVWWGKAYLEMSYGTHSDGLQYVTADMLSIPLAKWNLRKLLHRHKRNIDFRALYLQIIKFDQTMYDELLLDISIMESCRANQNPIAEYRNYWNLRKFEWEEGSKHRIDVDKDDDYPSERGYTTRGWANPNKSELYLLFPSYILKSLNKGI